MTFDLSRTKTDLANKLALSFTSERQKIDFLNKHTPFLKEIAKNITELVNVASEVRGYRTVVKSVYSKNDLKGDQINLDLEYELVDTDGNMVFVYSFYVKLKGELIYYKNRDYNDSNELPDFYESICNYIDSNTSRKSCDLEFEL